MKEAEAHRLYHESVVKPVNVAVAITYTVIYKGCSVRPLHCQMCSMTHVNLNTVISSNSVTAFNIEFEFNLDTKVFFSFFFKKMYKHWYPYLTAGGKSKAI